VSIGVVSNVVGRVKDLAGFLKLSFKFIYKRAIATGHKSREWLSIDRTDKHVTVKRHLVDEQTEEGEWKTEHDEEVKYPAKHRPKKQQPKKEER